MKIFTTKRPAILFFILIQHVEQSSNYEILQQQKIMNKKLFVVLDWAQKHLRIHALPTSVHLHQPVWLKLSMYILK